MTSKEIRAMNFNATWKQYFNLLQEITARMAEQAERTPAPETAGAHVSEVRSNPGNENGAWCEICCATLVCPSCGNHRSEPAAPPSDAVTQDIVMACCESYNNHDPWIPQGPRIESVLRTFAEALLEESDKTCKVLYSDERSLVNRVLTKAISNLLPEVKS
jgi:hypothetical protein